MSEGSEVSRLQSQLAALEQLLEVQEQAVLKQSDRLENTLAQFADILQSASDAIITIDESQRIILLNRQAEMIFGYQASEVIGKPLDLLIPNRFRSAHRGHVERFAAEPVDRRSMSERPELRALRKNGEEFAVEVTISKLRREDKWLFTAIVRDVTERKRMEEQVKQEKDELVRTNRMMMGREERVVELKHEVNALLQQLGQAPRYQV
jgi:PAS domain S-box-containing protein